MRLASASIATMAASLLLAAAAFATPMSPGRADFLTRSSALVLSVGTPTPAAAPPVVRHPGATWVNRSTWGAMKGLFR